MMEIKIAHMYPELLNLYGDKGNINALCKRLTWRGIDASVKRFDLNDDLNLEDIDILFIGGGSDREQKIVCERLLKEKEKIKEYVENEGVTVAVCGGYQLLGKYTKLDTETIDGLGILDLYTEQKSERLMGNVVIDSPLTGCKVTGFENHNGRTYSKHSALGKVIIGNGNNGIDKTEGSVYKNLIGTYLHGPVLPANPALTDYILLKAIEKKYGEYCLAPLDDSAEKNARDYIIKLG